MGLHLQNYETLATENEIQIPSGQFNTSDHLYCNRNAWKKHFSLTIGVQNQRH